MSDDDRPRDFWMCGHPGGCEEEPLWTPLTAQAPYCRPHDRRHERFSDLAKRAADPGREHRQARPRRAGHAQRPLVAHHGDLA